MYKTSLLLLSSLCAYGAEVNGWLDLAKITAPSAPGASFARLYVDSTSNILGCMNPDASSCMPVSFAGTTFKLDITSSGSTGTFRAFDQTATTGSTLAVIRAGAGQSTNNLVEYQNAAGTVLARITAGGNFCFGTCIANSSFSVVGVIGGSSDIFAGATNAIYFNARSVITSPANNNIKLSNLAQSDFGLLMFGGTTSSFPALKRSTTLLLVRLADDSGAATIQSKFNSSDGTAGVTVTVCTAFKDGLCISGS